MPLICFSQRRTTAKRKTAVEIWNRFNGSMKLRRAPRIIQESLLGQAKPSLGHRTTFLSLILVAHHMTLRKTSNIKQQWQCLTVRSLWTEASHYAILVITSSRLERPPSAPEASDFSPLSTQSFNISIFDASPNFLHLQLPQSSAAESEPQDSSIIHLPSFLFQLGA